MSKQRDGDGQYTETVDDGDILHHFWSGRRPFYSAGEIADAFDLERSQAHRRLETLAEDGPLRRVSVGSRNVVWWRPRDAAVFQPGDEGVSIVDTATGIASQGATRPEALRMLAAALEVAEGSTDVTPADVYDELGIDPDEVPRASSLPWDGEGS